MIRRFILYRLDKEERRLGASLDYLRHILRVSLSAFFKFAKIMPLATYRKTLPVDAYSVARLVATQHEDCGSCLQIEVNLAKSEGVSRDTIRATLNGEVEALSEQLADVYRFAEAVVRATDDDVVLREKVNQHYGDGGLVELALAIASCRVFPTTKRALGYAKSCRLVQIDV